MRKVGDGRAFVAALVLYAAFFGLFFFESLSTDELIAPGDALDFGVAAYLSSPSLWTDGLYSGYPIAADPQSMIFYPLLQLWRTLGLGWNLFMVAPFVIASASCFLLVRRLTGSALAGALGGLTFGFSGPMLGNIGHFNQLHAVAWAPLALYGLARIRGGMTMSGVAVASMSFALMWLAGHPQLPVYVSYLSAALLAGSLFLDRPSMKVGVRRVAWSGIAVALGVGLAAVMLLPMLELSTFSPRAEANWELYTAKTLPPWQILSLVVPFAFGFWADNDQAIPYFGDGSAGENLGYVGLVPLALAVVAPLVVSRRRGEVWLWVVLGVVAALLAMNAATPLGTLFYYAPGYARFRMPTRHLFLVALCIAVAAGFAFDALAQRSRRWVPGAATMAVALTGLVALAGLRAAMPVVADLLAANRLYAAWTIGWPLLVASAAAAIGLGTSIVPERRRALALGTLIMALLIVDLAVVHYRVPGVHFDYAEVPPSDATPRLRIAALRDELRASGERVLAADGTHNSFLLPNLTRPWGVRAAGGSGPLGIERYIDLMRMGSPGDVPTDVMLSPQLALDVWAIRYVLVPDNTPVGAALLEQPERWSRVDQMQYDVNDPDSSYTLYRNASALPAAWCVSDVQRADRGDSLDALRSGRLPGGAPFNPRTTVLAEPGELAGWTPGEAAAAARVSTLGSEPRTYRVESSAPCVLVASEPFYPWWRATVDGAPATPGRVNYAMVGVAVPAGTHQVALTIEPGSIRTGMGVTGLCLLLWCGVVGAAFTEIRRASAQDPTFSMA